MAISARTGVNIQITGAEELEKWLRLQAPRAARKAIKAGIVAGMNPVVKAVRREVNDATASDELKSTVRKSIGKKIASKRGQVSARVGFGVGKKHNPAMASRARPGVGISATNVHWPILGVGEQSIARGSKGERAQTTTGRKTGGYAPQFAGALGRAVMASSQQVILVAGRKLWQVMKREASRRAK